MIQVFFNSKLTTEIQACLALAVPLAAAQVAQSTTTFVDTIMMGWLGSQTLASGGLAGVSFSALLISTSGIVSAVSPLVAEAYGAGKHQRVTQITQQGLWLSLGLAIPITLLLGQMGALLRSMGQDETTVALAESYLQAIAWGFLPALGFATLRSFVAALSKPRPIMVIMVLGTAWNITANYVLMFGKLGFPALGLTGIGYASATAYWLMFLALLGYSLWHPQLRSYHLLHNLVPEVPLLRQVVAVGLPIGVLFAVETGLFTVATYLMGRLGTDSLAAHQIILQTAALTFMVPLGISQAATVRVGQYVGQGDRLGARQAGYVSIGVGIAFMSLMALLFITAPTLVVSIFLDVRQPENAQVVAIARSFLQVAALFQIWDGTQVVAGGALRGLQDTRIPMVIGIFSYWCVGMSCGYGLAFYYGLAGVGLWLGLAIGLAIASIILSWRFYHLTSRPWASS